MQIHFHVLSDDEKDKIHEESLRILSKTGVRVNTEKGRNFLSDAGAEVDESTHIVRLPVSLVEEAIRLAPKEFSLGARRGGWDLAMNNGDCVLSMDGEGVSAVDRRSGSIRPSLLRDWVEATRMGDMLDEVGVYWNTVVAHDRDDAAAGYVVHVIDIIKNFSKHIQESCSSVAEAEWLKEVLQIVFGDKDAIRKKHPWSFLLCPQSPLVIDEKHTDAYLALVELDIPAAVMPMPLMGTTAPSSMISTIILGNCEVIAMLCLVQAAAPGTPVIYAPVPSLMDPRNGNYYSGAVENGLFGAAETEMARYYGLPAESTGFSTNQFIPSIQSSYERSQSGLLTALSWPDILVGPGLLGGSMVLSLEQFLIDVELFRRSRRVRYGISGNEKNWLGDVISSVGPGGYFTAEPSTVEALRSGEWYMDTIGLHDPLEVWSAQGKPALEDELSKTVESMLTAYTGLPLSDTVEEALIALKNRAARSI